MSALSTAPSATPVTTWSGVSRAGCPTQVASKVMGTNPGESIHFWQTAPLAGVELLSARYIEQRFVPHVHDGFVIGIIMAGAQRYRYRGAEHLAGSGTLVLINPDELHTGHKGTEDGWLYRAF